MPFLENKIQDREQISGCHDFWVTRNASILVMLKATQDHK